jgi:hypothetical protein
MSDRAFWLVVYRGLMMIAAAIKKYKLGCQEAPILEERG